jgi:hypothetical protein
MSKVKSKNKDKDLLFTADNDTKEVAKRHTTAMDITKAGNISRDIIEITDTPDVATWNKEIQINRNVKNMAKRSQETKGITPITTAVSMKKRGSENLIIDPANKEDVAKVVNSGTSLTDKAEIFSMSNNIMSDISKKPQKAK